MEETFSKNVSWKIGDIFFFGEREGQIYWEAVLHGCLMIRSCQGRESFTNAFSTNLKTVNYKVFVNHERIYTLG